MDDPLFEKQFLKQVLHFGFKQIFHVKNVFHDTNKPFLHLIHFRPMFHYYIP